MRRAIIPALVLAAACGDSPAAPPIVVGPVNDLTAVPIATGLASPVHLAAPPGDPRLFVVEQAGRIRVIRGGALLPQPFLDITARVATGGERGLLSMAFDPDYDQTGRFWVNYTNLAGDTRIERYTVSADPDRADPASASLVIEIDQPQSNHNGGQIAFGPDGMLYIGMGDGGGGGDPQGHGQNAMTLLGALLRLDVRGAAPYAIPADNPYVGSTTARPEIWAIGLRNPWRFSIDHESGMLYIADVGQNEIEEINAVHVSAAGLNYGWNVMEGSQCYGAAFCDEEGLTLPVHEYDHMAGCSVTGGFVYRGARMPALAGTYFYADFCRGWLRSFRLSGSTATQHRAWDIGTLGNVMSFGVDAAGELYMLVASGTVYRLDPE